MNEQQRQQAVEILHTQGCSCVIIKGDLISTFHQRGVKDLYELLHEQPELLRGAFVADKVVGKGAASLMILGGVGELFADVVSSSALELLVGAGVRIEYGELVPHVFNRSQTDWCPLERLCGEASSAEECLPLIAHFLSVVHGSTNH